jgi:hypothetical protein
MTIAQCGFETQTNARSSTYFFPRHTKNFIEINKNSFLAHMLERWESVLLNDPAKQSESDCLGPRLFLSSSRRAHQRVRRNGKDHKTEEGLRVA